MGRKRKRRTTKPDPSAQSPTRTYTGGKRASNAIGQEKLKGLYTPHGASAAATAPSSSRKRTRKEWPLISTTTLAQPTAPRASLRSSSAEKGHGTVSKCRLAPALASGGSYGGQQACGTTFGHEHEHGNENGCQGRKVLGGGDDTANDGGSATPSEALERFMPIGGWRLASCFAQDCNCQNYASPNPGRISVHSALVCSSCGHRSAAHELVDSLNCQGRLSPGRQSFRGYAGQEGAGKLKAGSSALEGMAMTLRRLFAAIRNARALGDSGLFEDSEGLSGWGAGWFVSRLARRYLQQAQRIVVELGHDLHDAPSVARALATAEDLTKGDATGKWAIPRTLPSRSLYLALGTGVASELDLAYFHVRYTAASRFDAGDVTAGAPNTVIPPPEVYFICLAFHTPTLADVETASKIDDPAVRRVLTGVFDLPLPAAGAASEGPTTTSEHQARGEISFPVRSNQLLAVTQAVWLESTVSASSEEWVPHFTPRFGEPEGTMRGSDPALPPPVRTRCDTTRDWCARLLAFAVPNRRAVDACRRAVAACGTGHKRIIEIGAGLGYWKWVLEAAEEPSHGPSKAIPSHGRLACNRDVVAKGWRAHDKISRIQVLAMDRDPSRVPGHAVVAGRPRTGNGKRGGRGARDDRRHSKQGRHGTAKAGTRTTGQHERGNEYHGCAPAMALVEKDGPERLKALDAREYPILLLCYPPPSLGNAACMATEAMKLFSGNILLYVGETRGDTGSPRFESILQVGWDLREDIELPCFSSTANRLMVFVRKGSAKALRQREGDAVPAPHSDSQSRVDAVFGPLIPLFRCSKCGKAGDKDVELRRCRLTRAVDYCSERCFLQDRDNWRAQLVARHIHLTGVRGGPSLPVSFRDKKFFKRLAIETVV